jgi:hypothetical protein
VQTVPQSPSEHLTVDDVSVTPSSRMSSLRSGGKKTHCSPDDDSISDENPPLSNGEPSDAENYSLGSDK